MHAGSGRTTVTGALVLVQVFFGLHYFAAKLLLTVVPPRAWAVVRVSSAAVILLAGVLLTRRRLPRSPRDLVTLAALSIFGVVVNQVCFVEGLSRTTPTHSSLIITMIPVGTLFFAVALGREAISTRKVVSLFACLFGVMLVIGPWKAAFSSETVVGDVLTLINALSYSFFLVISKRILSRLDSLAATAVLLGFGAIWILMLGWGEVAAFPFADVPATTWWLAAYIVIFPTAGAYFLISWALARSESSLVALFIYLQPVIASALSIVFLGERPAPVVWTGAALIFGGVYLAMRPGQGVRASLASSSAPLASTDSSRSNLGE